MPLQNILNGGYGRLRRWALLLLASTGFWAIFVALATIYLIYATGFDHEPRHLPAEIGIVLLGGAYGTLVPAALRRLTGRPFREQIPLTALVALVVATLFNATYLAGKSAITGALHPALQQPQVALSLTLYWLPQFGLWAAITLALFHDAEARANERRLALLRAEAHEAQVRALRYQVNPHFLYNTLNSIASLILDRRNDAAEAMVLRLSDFFRASLANDPLGDVPLADELAIQRLYLDIEQQRFVDTLAVEFDVPGDTAEARVPSFILQPLIENALKHGLNEARRGTRLRVAARRLGDRLHLEVEDDGPGCSTATGTGLGLANVRRRLAARFGDAAAMEARGEPGCGFRVRLDMPYVAA